MKRIHLQRIHPLILATIAALPLAAAEPALTGFPFTDETLHYSLNWPSGLSLGTASLTARKTSGGWSFNVALDAAVPGFAIADKFRASAGPTPELCSAELARDFSHGGKKTRAKITFDQKAGTAHRVTMVPDEGGESNLNIPSCARDAVAFAYYARKELGQGRVPQPQQVFLGAGYSVRMDYTGAQNITLGESKEPIVTDHVAVTVKGPKADFVFEVFFARDAARRPLVVKIPLSLGMLSLELVR